MADREKEQELLFEVESAGTEARVIAMCDKGELLGYAAVEVQGDELKLLKLAAESYDFSQKPNMEQTFILDSLMRAAASYGENFGANQIVTAFPDFFQFFKLRGFQTDDSHAFTPMSTIVKYE